MNALKGLYIWTLVTLLILAGCLGGGVIDEGEGQSVPEDGDTSGGSGTTSGSTTIINNYYNNYSEPEIFAAGGINEITAWTGNQNGSNPNCVASGGNVSSIWGDTCEFIVHTIDTQQGEMLTFVGHNNGGVRMTSYCNGDTIPNQSPSGIAFGNGAMTCSHVLIHHVNEYAGSMFTPVWSIAYTITPVTVV